MQTVLDRLQKLETENGALRREVQILREEGVASSPASVTTTSSWDPPLPVTATGPSVYDAHVAPVVAPKNTRRLRVYGHMAINAWEGDRRVNAKAGRAGSTNIWDAAIGIESRLSKNTELKFRPVTIMPSLTGNGDGFGGGGAFLYMREAYVAVKRILGNDALNLRFGRVPYAFGDEYLQFDAPDNPLVSHSAAFGWGFDEGIHLYGKVSPEVSYIASLRLDGSLGNGGDTSPSKARGLKLMGDHGRHWHWSGSYFDTGTSGAQEFWFGRRFLVPVGPTGAPGGAAPNGTANAISAELWEGDVKYRWKAGYLALALGGGSIEDHASFNPLHDRRFEWFKVEPLWRFADRWYAAGRYSGVNVTNPLLGYSFRNLEDDALDLNHDINEHHRLSLGVGFNSNDAVTWKLEHTINNYTLIPTRFVGPPAASATASPNNRDYTVVQCAVTF